MLEESRSKFYQPFGLYTATLSHVFLGCENQLKIYDPVWLAVKQRAAGMDVDWRLFDEGLITLLWILFGTVVKVTTANCPPDLV